MLFEVIKKNKWKSVIALIIAGILFCFLSGAGLGTGVYFIVDFFGRHTGGISIFERLPNTDIAPFKWFFIFSAYCSVFTFFIYIYSFLSARKQTYIFEDDYEYLIYKIKPEKAKVLYNIAEELSIAAGFKKIPEIYIIDHPFLLNAYACGALFKDSIVVSKKLLSVLNRNELQAVVAHEMSHIANKDTLYLFCSGFLYEKSNKMRERLTYVDENGPGGCLFYGILTPACIFFIPYLFCICIQELVCGLLFFFISDKREYIADACAVLYTRNPAALASAMNKIQKIESRLICNNIEAMNPLIKASFFAPVKGDNTHPDTNDRIKILEMMKSADLNEYEKVYQKLCNKKLLPKSALKNEEKIKIKPNFIPPPLEGEGARSAGEGYTDAFDYSLRKESLQTGTARHARTLGGSQNIETNPSPLTPLPQGERGNTSTALPQGARGNISTALPQGETIFAACSLSSVISDEIQMQTIKENKELLNENIKKHREVEDMVQDLAGYTIINCDCCTKLKIPPVYKNQIIICPHCGKKHAI